MQDLFCHGTEDIPVFLAVQSLNKGTDLRESAAGVDRRVHAVAVKSQQGQIDLAELLAQVFCKTAVRKRTAPESVIVENTAVELCRGGVLADIVDPEFRVQIADGQKFSRKRTIGFIGVQVNPVDKVHFLENDRRIAGILDIIQNFRIVERRQMESRQVLFLRGKIIQGEHIYYVYIKKDVQSGLDIIEGTIWYFVVCLALVTLFCYLWMKKEGKEAICYGMGDGLEAVKRASEVGKNIVVSAAALEVAKYLEKTFGTPYEIGYPAAGELVPNLDYQGKKILVVHQQVMAEAIRQEILKRENSAEVQTATWFMRKKELACPQDVSLREEDDYIDLVKNGGFDIIFADACMEKMVPDFQGIFVNTRHFAVSGRLCE